MQEAFNNKKDEHQSSQMRRLRTIILIVSVYLFLCLTLVITFFPHLKAALNVLIDNIDPFDKLVYFLTFLGTFIGLFSILISSLFKYKDLAQQSATSANSTNAETVYFGKYRAERQYLEDKISELTDRLTEKDENWAKINQLIISGSPNPKSPSSHISINTFLEDFGISLNEITVERRSAFMLTPSTSEYNEHYEVVASVCRSCGLQITRGDEKDINYASKNMLGHIVRHILSAGVIIANISNRNPNVFYELGLAHMIGKPTILICNRGQEVPFDILQRYIIFYDSNQELEDKLKTELLRIYINE